MFRKYGVRIMQETDGDDGGAADAGGLGGDIGGTNDEVPGATVDENVDLSNVPAWAQKLNVDADILSDPSLKAINDIDSLTKSYVHAQRKIGQKGVILPNENSTKEEWDTFYQKAGVPLEQQDYISKVELPSQEDGSAFDEGFNEQFLNKAHELRIRPDQASQMYRFFNEQAQSKTEVFTQEMETQRQEGLNKLRDTLGEDAYNVQITKAGQLIKEELGQEFHGYLQETGLGKDPKLVEAFMNLATKFYKEEPVPRDGSRTAMTKDQMQEEINLAMGNFDDPYHRPEHPDHKRRVNEIQKFFAKMEGGR
jgi:hypothetical protein